MLAVSIQPSPDVGGAECRRHALPHQAPPAVGHARDQVRVTGSRHHLHEPQ